MPDLSPDEAITKLKGLPEDQQRAVLEQLDPDTRKSILTKLTASPAAGTPSSASSTTAAPAAQFSAPPAMFSKGWFMEKLYRPERALIDLLPSAGGVAGGLIGGGAGVEAGPGAIATGVAGAAVGGAAGRAVAIPLERALFPTSKGWTSGPVGTKAVAEDIAGQGAIQGASEITGRFAGRFLSPAAKYFGDTALASSRAGVKLLPSEARGGAESYVEKFLKGSVLTAGKMEKFRLVQNAQTRAAAENVANQLSTQNLSPEATGELIQKGIEAHTAAFRAQQNAMYGDIDKAVQEKVVNSSITTQPSPTTHGELDFPRPAKTVLQSRLEGPAMPSTDALKEFAKKELKLLDQQEKILDPNLLSSSRAMLQKMVDSPDKVTFKAMASSRSDMLALTRRSKEALSGKQAGFAKKLAGLMDESMMKAAEDSGITGLPDAVRNANALTAETHRIYQQQLVKAAVKSKKPEVITRLLRSNKFGLQETRDLMGVLPEVVKPAVQKQIVLDNLKQATDESGMFNEGKFVQGIAKMDDGRGEIIFGKNWKNIQELSELMGKINGPSGITSGSGASLQNYSVMKNVANSMLSIIPIGFAAEGGHHGIMTGLGSLAGEAAGLNLLAAAITNPGAAAKMVKAARVAFRAGSYTAAGGYNVAIGQGKVTRDLQKIRDQHVQQMQSAAQ